MIRAERERVLQVLSNILGNALRFTPQGARSSIAERAGQEVPFGWHVVRYAFASHLVMRGVPLKAVQELMGHATMEMTLRYAHLAPDVRRDAVGLLDLPSAA
jgi:site-specific recombinase XerD